MSTYLTPRGKMYFAHPTALPAGVWCMTKEKPANYDLSQNKRQKTSHSTITTTDRYDIQKLPRNAIGTENEAVGHFRYNLLDEWLQMYFKNLKPEHLDRITKNEKALFKVAASPTNKYIRIYSFCPIHEREHQSNCWYITWYTKLDSKLLYRDYVQFGCFNCSPSKNISYNKVSFPVHVRIGVSDNEGHHPLLPLFHELDCCDHV